MRVTIHRSLLLVPALAAGILGAACGSHESPGSPSDLVSLAPEAGAGAEATTLAAAGCREVSAVRLQLLPSPASSEQVHVKATYVSLGPIPGCTLAPEWSSRPVGLLSVTKDPFVAALRRSGTSRETLVRAQAPNGVRGEIRIRW